MDDERQTRFMRQPNLPLEVIDLYIHRTKLPVIIQAGFANCDDLGVLRQLAHLIQFGQRRVLAGIGVNADGREDFGMSFGQFDRPETGSQRGRHGENFADSMAFGVGNDVCRFSSQLLVIQVGVSIKYQLAPLVGRSQPMIAVAGRHRSLRFKRSDWLAAHETTRQRMPVLDLRLVILPTQINHLVITHGRKVHQAFGQPFGFHA